MDKITCSASAAVDAAMRDCVEAGEIAGAVTLIASCERILHLSAVGLADIDAGQTLTVDALFWIASMTKPVTAAAALLLQDEGRLSMDDLVTRYLPEFADLKTPAGNPAVITLRRLLTHTSGMGEMTFAQQRTCASLADAIPYYLAAPMQFAPGERWHYCQSSINTAARVVEVVSGMDFPEFLQRRLFAPLGMSNTTFYPNAAQMARLAKTYARTADDTLVERPVYFLDGIADPGDPRRFPAANGGLFSSASDYVRFAQMLLNDGMAAGARLLSQAAAEELRTVHTAELVTGFTPGNGWGLGVCVVREPQGITAMLAPGSFGHGGAYGTQVWLDPVNDRIYLLLVQRENFDNSDASPVRLAFQQAATSVSIMA